MVIGKNLTIATTRGFHAATAVAHGHNCRQLACSGSSRRSQRDELSAGTTREVINVDAHVNPSRGIPNSSSDCVHATFNVSVGINGFLRSRNEFQVVIGELAHIHVVERIAQCARCAPKRTSTGFDQRMQGVVAEIPIGEDFPRDAGRGSCC